MRVLFQISGSIACYKACSVVSRLVQDGHSVKCVSSEAALHFVGRATWEGLTGERLHTDTFAPGEAMAHIELGKWADILVLCPASASRLNKLSAGLGDDLVGAIFLAHDFAKPYLIAPAMNSRMWNHPSTVESISRLKGWGATFIDPESGSLACGETGDGRLAAPETILAAILAAKP